VNYAEAESFSVALLRGFSRPDKLKKKEITKTKTRKKKKKKKKEI
jgi:hypothetical protein